MSRELGGSEIDDLDRVYRREVSGGPLPCGHHAIVLELCLNHSLIDSLVERIRDALPMVIAPEKIEAIFTVIVADRKPGGRSLEFTRDDLAAIAGMSVTLVDRGEVDNI